MKKHSNIPIVRLLGTVIIVTYLISIKLIGRDNPIKIDSIINYGDKNEILKIEFDRDENNPI